MEFTGRENVITGSILAGLTRKEAEARLPEVIRFAELEDFIDAPLRTYSSGMFVRLAFATEINLDPDILLIDEVLAVGDIAFQRKCLNYLRELRTRGKTIIVVSHSMSQILQTCDSAIWLENGKVRQTGAAADVVRAYQLQVLQSTTSAPTRRERTGHDAVTVDALTLYSADGERADTLPSGAGMLARIAFTAHTPLYDPIFQVGIFNNDGTKCYEINTRDDDMSTGTVSGTHTLSLSIAALPLSPGTYRVNVGIYSSDWSTTYTYRVESATLTVYGDGTENGIISVPHHWGAITRERPPNVAALPTGDRHGSTLR